MATRSTISLETESGKVWQIYCHWDGYVGHNGIILQENYCDYKTVFGLIEKGSMSCLDETLSYCDFYGDEYSQPLEFQDLKDFYKNFQSEEYNYLWTKGSWWVNIGGSDVWEPLKEKIAIETI